MDNTSMILSGLVAIAIAILVGPRIFAMNKGKNLNYIALWLLIIFALAFFYQHWGPGKAEITAETGTGTAPQEEGFVPPKE